MTSAETRWRECARSDVSYRVPGTNGEVGWKFNLGGVELRNDVLTVSMAGINRKAVAAPVNRSWVFAPMSSSA
jgi:hypothetical protein